MQRVEPGWNVQRLGSPEGRGLGSLEGGIVVGPGAQRAGRLECRHPRGRKRTSKGSGSQRLGSSEGQEPREWGRPEGREAMRARSPEGL